MITFRLRLPCRTILRVFSRNSLVRGTDRLEAVVMLLAVTVSLLTIPFAAAAGTAVHDSRSHVYAHQAQTRHPATATVIDHEGDRQQHDRHVSAAAHEDHRACPMGRERNRTQR